MMILFTGAAFFISIICCAESSLQNQIYRKVFRATASVAVAICVSNPSLSFADVGTNDIQCKIKLPTTISAIYGQAPASAIYLTAKQDVGFINAQIRNFKPPAILTSRTQAPFSFPKEIVLNGQADLTPEGLGLLTKWQAGKQSLIVSARLDVDGIAATRNAEDLIGKAVVSKDAVSGKWIGCEIDLEDRGLGGRIVTKKLK